MGAFILLFGVRVETMCPNYDNVKVIPSFPLSCPRSGAPYSANWEKVYRNIARNCTDSTIASPRSFITGCKDEKGRITPAFFVQANFPARQKTSRYQMMTVEELSAVEYSSLIDTDQVATPRTRFSTPNGTPDQLLLLVLTLAAEYAAFSARMLAAEYAAFFGWMLAAEYAAFSAQILAAEYAAL